MPGKHAPECPERGAGARRWSLRGACGHGVRPEGAARSVYFLRLYFAGPLGARTSEGAPGGYGSLLAPPAGAPGQTEVRTGGDVAWR